MPSLKYEGGTVELDTNGYLTNINAWNESVAEAIATREGIKKLTEDRLEVIRFLRSYYMKFNSFPLLDMVCTNVHQPKNCTSKPFKMDPLKAWKVAGLPYPGEEVLVYLKGPIHPEE